MKTEEFFNDVYKTEPPKKYPNEELVRCIQRNFTHDRANMTALDIGCGSGNNMAMMQNEGFLVHGIDISDESMNLCKKWKHMVRKGSMTDLPYDSGYFDLVADVFSSYCLNHAQFICYLHEVMRVLKPNGVFFFYNPALTGEQEMITIRNLSRGPYAGHKSEFSFFNPIWVKDTAHLMGFSTERLESIQYSSTDSVGKHYFDFVVMDMVKI